MQRHLRRPIEVALIAGMLLITIASLSPFDLEFIRPLSAEKHRVMLGMLSLGMLFLFMSKQRLFVTAFSCTAALCYFIKISSNGDTIMYYPPNDEETLTISHINASANNDDYRDIIRSILNSDADLVTVSDVTPDWYETLNEALSTRYPYVHATVRIDIFGQAVFSKYRFTRIDTFMYEDIPNYLGTIEKNGKFFHFTSSHTSPSFLDEEDQMQLTNHLGTITRNAEELKGGPYIAMGSFNTLAWSSELANFRQSLALHNSRRSATQFGKEAYEHIFYSNHLECTGYEDIATTQGTMIGVVGTYQFKESPLVAKF